MLVRGWWGYGWSIKPLAEALGVNMVCPSKETDGSFKVMLVLVRRQETREIARSIQGALRGSTSLLVIRVGRAGWWRGFSPLKGSNTLRPRHAPTRCYVTSLQDTKCGSIDSDKGRYGGQGRFWIGWRNRKETPAHKGSHSKLVRRSICRSTSHKQTILGQICIRPKNMPPKTIYIVRNKTDLSFALLA